MIKLKVFFLLIFITNLTTVRAQKSVNQFDNNGERHGLWTKNYYNTDQKRYEGMFVHGKEVDSFKYYKLSNGKSVLSAVKVFNQKDSIADVTFYTSNKKVISEGKMNGKRFIGQWVYYHKNSAKKMIIENYNTSGKLDGERKVLFENGVVAEHANYSNGKLNGESKWYSENNKLIKIANFENGSFHGKYATYDLDGNISTEGNYVDDKKHGIWNFYEDGKKIKFVDYSKD